METYIGHSKSATDRTNVPRLQSDGRRLKAGAFEALICYNLDRATRQPRQFEDWIDAAELRGLALFIANGDEDGERLKVAGADLDLRAGLDCGQLTLGDL